MVSLTGTKWTACRETLPFDDFLDSLILSFDVQYSWTTELSGRSQ